MRCRTIFVAIACIAMSPHGLSQELLVDKLTEIGTGVSSICNTITKEQGHKTDQEIRATASVGINSLWARIFGSAKVEVGGSLKESHFDGLTQEDIAKIKIGDRACRETLATPLARLIQCAPTARFTSGGRIHPGSCR
jgi:hypothetical protein